VAVIYAAGRGHLDDVPIEQVRDFEARLLAFLGQQYSGLLAEFSAGHWDSQLEQDLKAALARFKEHVWLR
jgi:F-type H+-transporting ATPase subunit alpha